MAVTLTDEMIKGAQATQEKYGVPASITLGQIMLESGGSYSGGLSALAYKYNNLFGMKGSGTSGSVVMSTREEGQGTVNAKFASYNSVADSIEAHGQLLATDRYTQYTKNATTVREYAEGIKKGGYATDSSYVDKLMSIIESNNLTQYDSGIFTSSDDELKWYGDLAVIVFTVLLIIIGIFLFVGAWTNNNPVDEVKKTVKKVKNRRNKKK